MGWVEVVEQVGWRQASLSGSRSSHDKFGSGWISLFSLLLCVFLCRCVKLLLLECQQHRILVVPLVRLPFPLLTDSWM
jgi:hypothetical protein